MASSKTGTNKKTLDRGRKGTTTRRSSTLKAALLLVPVLAILAAAFARGVEAHHGDVPDWRPSAASDAAAH